MSELTGWLNQDFMGNPLSKYLFFFLVLFVAYSIYHIILKVSESQILKRLVDDKRELYQGLLKIARNPLKLVLGTVAFWIGVRIFELPETAQLVIQNLFLALFAVTVCYVVLKVIDVLVAFMKPRVTKTESRLDDHLLPIFSTTAKVFIIVITVLLVIQNWGYNITSLIAGLGLGGLAFALAAQDTLSNVFGAIAIFVDQPFHIGDVVQLEGILGSVEHIGIRSTRIRTFEGTLVTIPNSTVANSKIDNYQRRPTRRTNFTIGVTYDTTTEKLETGVQIIREVMESHPGTAQYRAYFNSYGNFSLNILAHHYCKYLDYEEYLKCIEEINFEIKKRFEAEGIEFAFPTQTLYLKADESETDGLPSARTMKS